MLLLQAFKAALNTYEVSIDTQEALWQEVVTRHQASHRHYHTLQHLTAILQHLSPVKSNISHWEATVFAIAYHDIVYNPIKKDNEEKSAILAQKRLNKHIPTSIVDLCYDHILATKSHEVSSNHDRNLFTDADLSILGSEWDVYQLYTQQIRKEYQLFPDLLYKPGRKKVIQHFLDMPKIYKSEYFYRQFESKAKANLSRELALL